MVSLSLNDQRFSGKLVLWGLQVNKALSLDAIERIAKRWPLATK
jgi:hypothetical protein